MCHVKIELEVAKIDMHNRFETLALKPIELIMRDLKHSIEPTDYFSQSVTLTKDISALSAVCCGFFVFLFSHHQRYVSSRVECCLIVDTL
jgi:hypothetical protein